jgi:hypothetical protein
MKLLFSYQKPYQFNSNIIPKKVNNSIIYPNPTTTSLGSIFERLKNTSKCNSCSGAK